MDGRQAVCVCLDELWPLGHGQQQTLGPNTCKLARPCIMKHKLAPGKHSKVQNQKHKLEEN